MKIPIIEKLYYSPVKSLSFTNTMNLIVKRNIGIKNDRIFAFTRLIEKDESVIYEKNPEELAFFGLGGLLMAGLIYMRFRFVWWPLHPVGLAISGSYLARRTSFTTFLAWLIKFVMMILEVSMKRGSKKKMLSIFTQKKKRNRQQELVWS